MATDRFCFDRFVLDVADRKLTRDGAPVEVNARYFDALVLLASADGGLVSKDRFMAEVWRGVQVTDEALTQCIRTLRRILGDDAARPRFIETVPKHGYRFIAPLWSAEHDRPVAPARRRTVQQAVAGTLGGGVAGALVGLGYGMGGASPAPGTGAASLLLVLVCVSITAGLIAAVGVAGGIALAGRRWPGRWAGSMLGGSGGGLIVGMVAKLIGLDAFSLLLGQSPGEITGAAEGALTGAAVGLAAWLGRRGSLERCLAIAGAAGGVTGAVIPVLGGRLMGGSLDLVARGFAGSRFRLDRIGALFGETGFGPVSQTVTGALEGAVFAACVVGAMWVARGGPAPER